MNLKLFLNIHLKGLILVMIDLPNKISLEYLYNMVLQKVCKGGDIPLIIQPLSNMIYFMIQI